MSKNLEDDLSEGFFDAGLFGVFRVCWSNGGLVSFKPSNGKQQKTSYKVPDWIQKPLAAYFRGEEQAFEDLPLDLKGTDFQKRVWSELQSIPFGEVRSYKEVAVAIGKPTASRAVGMANHKNPVPIVVPCHRVIGSGGQLTGYAFGLEMKSKLLEFEGKM